MLEYLALFFLIFASLAIFYGIIVIHDIPYEIAKKRNHPHLEAIHYAGWVSLFTLHVIWPFLWIWATLWDEKKGWGSGNHQKDSEALGKLADATQKMVEVEQKNQQLSQDIEFLRQEVSELSRQLAQLSHSKNEKGVS